MFDVEIARVESMGIKLCCLPLSEKWTTIQGALMVTNEKMIKEHPDRVIGFGRAAAKSTLFTPTKVEAAVKIFYKMCPQTMPKRVMAEEAKKDTVFVLNARLPKLTIENRRMKKWGYLNPRVLESDHGVHDGGLEGQNP
jgi:NitT/TauT family transport system substrate-binding protein